MACLEISSVFLNVFNILIYVHLFSNFGLLFFFLIN